MDTTLPGSFVWPRYSAIAAAALLFNEALLGALLVLPGRIGGLDRSAAHALLLYLHFSNTLLLLAALALTARWLSNPGRDFPAIAKGRHWPWSSVRNGHRNDWLAGQSGGHDLPSDSLRHALMQDFSASSHVLLRIRLLHPVAAVMGSMYVFWLRWSLWRKQDHSPWMFALGAALTTQIALGAMNVILLAPIGLQMTHLLVAKMFWILLVLASADLLFASCRRSALA